MRIQWPYLKGYLLVLVKEHAELTDADPEVSICEFVRDVEAKGSKLSPFQSHPMKHTERKQEQLELRDL